MPAQIASLVGRLARGLRPHWLFVVAAPIAIIVMTQPSLAIVADVDSLRVPTAPSDIFMKYWDAWYGEEMLAGRADFFHTDLLFHPNELSLVFHNFSLPHMLVFGSLQKVLPPVNAYVLTYLLIIAANLLAAYVFLLCLVTRPVVACAGAFVFGMSTFVLKHQEHPDMALIATIPLTLYCLHRALHEGRWRWRLIAGILAGFTAFIGMYVFVCLMMTLGIYALFLAQSRWRDARFWQLLALLLLIAGVISLARVYPMIADRALLGEALDKRGGVERHNDLLMLFVNTDHPLMWRVKAQLFAGRRLWDYGDGYLGYLPLVVIGLCLLRSPRRRQMLPWLVIAALFIVLRLGSVLTIGGHWTGIPMPKLVLDRLLPWVFEAFWDISNFQIGILLPWAALFCLSLDWLLRALSLRRRVAAVVLVLLAICFENYSHNIWSFSSDPERLDWLDWLESEDDFEDIYLIHLPMGRNQSKQYGYFQTFNRIPHVEGLASRTPSQAYATIEGNLLLNTWRNNESVLCTAENRGDYLRAVDELRELGFTHIVYHRQQLGPLQTFASIDRVPSIFDDRFATIILVEDLPFACDWQKPRSAASQAQKALLRDYPALRSAPGITTIAIHSESLVTMSTLHSQMRVDLAASARRAHAEKLLSDQVGALLTSSEQQPDDLAQALRDWLAEDFDLCDTLSDGGEWRIDVFLRSGSPCDLLFLQPLRVDYDNGLRMSNLALVVDSQTLNLFFLWRAFPDELHSFSLQLVDAADARVLGFDRVIYTDELVHHQVDLSSLPPGDYRAKLIVYNYETRRSVPGVIVEGQTPFQREVDVGSFAID